jgi:hypothetical protein
MAKYGELIYGNGMLYGGIYIGPGQHVFTSDRPYAYTLAMHGMVATVIKGWSTGSKYYENTWQAAERYAEPIYEASQPYSDGVYETDEPYIEGTPL